MSRPPTLLRDRAVAAALAVARALGLDVSQARVLADRSNLTLALDPAPIVARVATTTAIARIDVRAFFAREISVAGYLADRGASVVPPSGVVPPGPHEHDGMVVSLWEHAEGETNVAGPEAVAGALRELHTHLRGYPEPLPRLLPALEEPSVLLARLERCGGLAIEDVILLRDAWLRLAPVLARAGPDQPLHGDAHASNVFTSPQGLRFCDFEDTCAGPVAWDLACLLHRHRGSSGFEGTAEGVLSAYGADLSLDELRPFLEARWLQATLWWAMIARRFPDQRFGLDESLRLWRER